MLPESALVPLQRERLDPVPELGRLREQAPISLMELPLGVRAWLVTGYDEARAVLAATAEDFSNDFQKVVGTARVDAVHQPGGLGFSDPPDHTRLRQLVTPDFTLRSLSRLAPRIEAIVAGQLDEMAAAAADGGPVDLVAHFAHPIPAMTICELLGIPYQHEDEDFRRLSAARFDFLGGADSTLGAISQSLGHVLEVVQRQRAEPGDGLLGKLLKSHGDELSDVELAGLVDGLLTGGLETTASMLALGSLVLLQEPAAAARLRDDDRLATQYVEELLRYLTVVQLAFPRVARRDVTVGGVQVLTGDIVLASLSGANRDPRLGPGADRFDPSQPASRHLAFGHGMHRCIGAELARMELRAAYPALLRRFPNIRLAAEAQQPELRQLSFVFGVDQLPVHLD
jgi:cytochrome P450